MYHRYPMNQNVIAEALELSCADGPMSYRTPDGRTILCKGGGKGGKGVVGMVLGAVATVVTAGAAAPLMVEAFGAGMMANVATGAIAGAAGGLAGTGTLKGSLTGAALGGIGGGIMGAVSNGGANVGGIESAGAAGEINAATGMPNYATDSSYFASGAGINTTTGMPNYATEPSNFSSSYEGAATGGLDGGVQYGGGETQVGLNTGADIGQQTLEGSQFSAPYQNTPDYSAATPGQSTVDYSAPAASSQTTQPGGTLDAPAADPQQVSANNAPAGGETKTSAPGAPKGGPEDPWYKKMDWAGAGLKVGANLLGAQAKAPGADDMSSYLKDVQGMEKTAQNYNIASADKKAAIGDKLAVNAGAMDPNYYASQSQNATKNRGNAQKQATAERMRAQGMDPQAINAELARMDIGNSQNEGTAYDSGYQTGVSNQNATYGTAGSMYGQVGQPSAGLASAYQANNRANADAQKDAGNMIEQATGILTKTTKPTPEKIA